MAKKKREIRVASAEELTPAEYEVLADISRRSFAEYKGDDINFRDAEMTAEQLRQQVIGETLFIMYSEGTAAGYARGVLRPTAEGVMLRCEGNCSLPEFRRYSPGVLLTKAREKWAIEQGAVYSELDTSCRAKKAIAYHHANGYKNWYYIHYDGKTYNSIAMRKDYGQPYPTHKRLKRLFRTWLSIFWHFKSNGTPRRFNSAQKQTSD